MKTITISEKDFLENYFKWIKKLISRKVDKVNIEIEEGFQLVAKRILE